MTFLLLYWKWAVLGVFIVGCAATVGITKYQLANAKAETAEYKAAYTILTAAAKECSASVAAFQESEANLAKSAQAALAEAKIVRDRAKNLASILVAATKPKGVTDCEATTDLLNTSITGLH